jgi:manganese oxidase
MPRIEYWLQIENQPWDVAPNGLDRATGERFTRGANGLFRPLPSEALIIRRYTPNWAAPDDHPLNAWDLNEPNPSQTRGTIPGATIEAKVGDEIIVHFRNMDLRANVSEAERTHSLHLHGVQRFPFDDGTYPYAPPDPAQNNQRGDRVPPRSSFDYHYTVPHLSTAGVWAYHDASIAQQASIGLGAFGAVVVRQGGEARPQLPTQPLRGASDTPTSFANVPQPPSAGEHLFVVHELTGVGECLNGRQGAGNTPTVLARHNARAKFRVLNLTTRAQTFHLHGHRWRRGDDWTDAETIPAGGGFTFEVLEGTAENGGGHGEWAITIPTAPQLKASLIVTDGGALTLV